MENWTDIIVHDYVSIEDTLVVIDQGGARAVVVTSREGKLKGVVTDGDIRRALLNKVDLKASISHIMSVKPFVITDDTPSDIALDLLKLNRLMLLPVVDSSMKLVGVKTLTDLLDDNKPEFENRVVLMAGGLGTRLRPLTENCPKPLLKIGEKPILQRIVQNFTDVGFNHFYISVNYHAQMIMDYFKDGAELGAHIQYLVEDSPLGTAGSLGLIKEKMTAPFFVMNGDVLTNVDFVRMLEFHDMQNADITLCVREYATQVPFGVVNLDNSRVTHIHEKPVIEHFVNAGIYCISPKLHGVIPQNTFYDMTQLIDYALKNNLKVAGFPLREYWRDVGQLHDFEAANRDCVELE